MTIHPQSEKINKLPHLPISEVVRRLQEIVSTADEALREQRLESLCQTDAPLTIFYTLKKWGLEV